MNVYSQIHSVHIQSLHERGPPSEDGVVLSRLRSRKRRRWRLDRRWETSTDRVDLSDLCVDDHYPSATGPARTL